MKIKNLLTMALAGVMTFAVVGCGAVGIDGETSSDKTETQK